MPDEILRQQAIKAIKKFFDSDPDLADASGGKEVEFGGAASLTRDFLNKNGYSDTDIIETFAMDARQIANEMMAKLFPRRPRGPEPA